MKVCIICGGTKPLTDFSTITRRYGRSSRPEDESCTSCYWNQLVSVYPSHSLEGVTYLPHNSPQTQYIDEMKRWLPEWMKDENFIKAYSALGEVGEQVSPFWEFVKRVESGQHE